MKSLVTPFNVVGGRISSTTDLKRIVEQKIIDVLVTGKLERSMLPNYGGGVQQLLFEEISDLVNADLKIDLGSEITSNVSGVSILDIKITQTPFEDSAVTIKVLYQTALSAIQVLTFSVSADTLTEESLI